MKQILIHYQILNYLPKRREKEIGKKFIDDSKFIAFDGKNICEGNL